MKYERQLGKLTEKQLEVFQSLQHCLNAAKLLISETEMLNDKKEIQFETAKAFIRSALYELEQRKKLELEIWDKIRLEYKLDGDEFKRLFIDEDTGDVFILTKEYFNKKDDLIGRLSLIWGVA